MIVRKAKISTLCLMLIALAFVLLQGCALRPDHTAWERHAIGDLTDSWGQPDRTEPLGVDYFAYTWVQPGASCEQTFLVSEGRISGYSSTGCDD